MSDAAYGAGSWLTKPREKVLPKTLDLMNLSSNSAASYPVVSDCLQLVAWLQSDNKQAAAQKLTMLASAWRAQIDADNSCHQISITTCCSMSQSGIDKWFFTAKCHQHFVTVHQKELPSPAALAAQQQSIGTLARSVSSRQYCSNVIHEACALYPD